METTETCLITNRSIEALSPNLNAGSGWKRLQRNRFQTWYSGFPESNRGTTRVKRSCRRSVGRSRGLPPAISRPRRASLRAFTVCVLQPAACAASCAFRGLVDPRWREPLERELKWLGSLLGGVRDVDVLLARLRKAASTQHENDAKRYHRCSGRFRRSTRPLPWICKTVCGASVITP